MLTKLGRIISVLFVALWITTPRAAHAVQIDYCESSVVPASISDLDQCTWLSRQQLSIKGFLRPKKWLRLQTGTFVDKDKAVQDLAIHVAPHFISSISLYKENSDGSLSKEATAGSLYPSNNPHDVIGGYLFITKASAKESRFYLKIDFYTAGYVGVTIEPWPTGGIQSQLGIGLHLGGLILILVYAVSSYLLNPNQLMGRFSLLLLCSLLSVLAGSGILAHSVFSSYPRLDLIFFALISSIRLALWVWLCQAFLESYQVGRWYKVMCNLAYLISAICFVLSLDLQGGLVQPLLITGTVLIATAQIIAIVRTPGIDQQYRRLLTIGFSSIALILIAMSATALLPVFPDNLAIHFARITVLLPIMLIASLIIFQNRKTRDDLAAVKNELNAVNLQRDLTEKLHEERRMMMDMLTHELKNPLATITLATASVNEQVDTQTPDVQRRIYKINQAVANMDAVIERCNLANTLNQAELRVDRAPVELPTLLANLIDSLSQPARVRLQLDPDKTSTLITDPYLVQIIFSNLLDNALKYALTDSLIDISISIAPDRHLAIVVSNPVEAALIPDPDQLFKRFYRHPQAHKTSGSGLGLFLVRGLCERLGGKVTCRIEKGLISFRVELPL